MKKALSLVLSFICLICQVSYAATAAKPLSFEPTFSAAQKQEIGQIVRDYLLANPEILVETSKALQLKQMRNAIEKNAKRIFASRLAPLTGNKIGKVNVVEFFDYQCQHCRRMAPIIDKLIKANPRVRFVFKELPIFGATSQFAASTALAADKQNAFLAFHKALLTAKKRLTEKSILEIAKKTGLNIEKLKLDAKSYPILNELKENYVLADSLGIQGTPAYIIGRYPSKDKEYRFFAGATSAKELQAAIDAISKSQ